MKWSHTKWISSCNTIKINIFLFRFGLRCDKNTCTQTHTWVALHISSCNKWLRCRHPRHFNIFFPLFILAISLSPRARVCVCVRVWARASQETVNDYVASCNYGAVSKSMIDTIMQRCEDSFVRVCVIMLSTATWNIIEFGSSIPLSMFSSRDPWWRTWNWIEDCDFWWTIWTHKDTIHMYTIYSNSLTPARIVHTKIQFSICCLSIYRLNKYEWW